MARVRPKVSFTINKALLAKLDDTVNAVTSYGNVRWFAPHYRSALIEAAIDHYLQCDDGHKKILALNNVKLVKKKR